MTSKSKVEAIRFPFSQKSESTKLGVLDSGSGYTAANQLIESMNGGDYPGWRRAIAQGTAIINNATASRTRFHYKGGYCSIVRDIHNWNGTAWATDDTRTYKYDGQMFSLPQVSFAGSSFGNTDNRAKALFVKKARAAMTQFQSGVFLGELRETLELLHKPYKAIPSLIKSYLGVAQKRRRGFRKASIPAKHRFLQEQWLQASFGIRPLIHDVADAARALAQYNLGHKPRQSVLGFAKAEGPQPDAFTGGSYQQMSWELTTQMIDKSASYAWGAVQASQDRTTPALQNVGLALQDFIPTIWELIPYSFLLDYFVNVDDILDAATFNTANLVYWGLSSKTSRTLTAGNARDTTNRKDSPDPFGSFVVGGGFDPGKGSWTAEQFARVGYGSLVPSLSFKIPGNWSQYVNMAALATVGRKMSPY